MRSRGDWDMHRRKRTREVGCVPGIKESRGRAREMKSFCSGCSSVCRQFGAGGTDQDETALAAGRAQLMGARTRPGNERDERMRGFCPTRARPTDGVGAMDEDHSVRAYPRQMQLR